MYLSVCVFVYVSICLCLFVHLFFKTDFMYRSNLAAERVRVREEGQVVRDNLRENMPGPTRRERRLLNFV